MTAADTSYLKNPTMLNIKLPKSNSCPQINADTGQGHEGGGAVQGSAGGRALHVRFLLPKLRSAVLACRRSYVIWRQVRVPAAQMHAGRTTP